MTERDARRLWNNIVNGRYGFRYQVEDWLRQGKENYIKIKDTEKNESFTVRTIREFEGRRFRDDPWGD